MAGIKFGRLKHKIEYEIYINAYFIKKLYEKIIFLANNQDKKKRKYKFGQNKIWGMANIFKLDGNIIWWMLKKRKIFFPQKFILQGSLWDSLYFWYFLFLFREINLQLPFSFSFYVSYIFSVSFMYIYFSYFIFVFAYD